MSRRQTAAFLLAASTAVLVFAACGSEGETPNDAEGDQPVAPAVPAKTSKYPVVVTGAFPWNNSFYVGRGNPVDETSFFGKGMIVNDDGTATAVGAPGEEYVIRTEQQPTKPERALLWYFETRGTFGDRGELIEFSTPDRAVIDVVTPPGHGGPDRVVVSKDGTEFYASVIRNQARGLFISTWKGNVARSYRHTAPNDPWRVEELLPGKCVIAAHTRGRHWIVQRADLVPGAKLTLNVAAAPLGGATVVCENGDAVLLLQNEFRIPAPRRDATLAFRATWENVPPGKHTVRYPDGETVEITVEEGVDIKLGRKPPE